MTRKIAFIILTFFLLNSGIQAQNTDAEYPYVLPIWGQKALDRGYNLPLPFGIMSNSFFNTQDLLISDLQLSLGDNPLVPIPEEILEFGKVNAKVLTTNIRADAWILPFLNVYGFGGVVSADMEVNLVQPVSLTTNTNNSGTYFGFGVMGAGKAGPVFFTGDINFAWTNLKLLKKPTLARIIGLRVGHRFLLKNKPKQNIALWVGAMNQNLASNTVGSISVEDTFDPTDEEIQDIQDWYDGLPDGPLKDLVGELINEIGTPSSTIINYSLKKELKSKWNGLVGAQWQINYHWQIRTEFGFGSKQQTLLSVNYRFGI